MSEKELQESLALLDLYRAQIESLAEQQQIIQATIEEHARAKSTLASVSETEEGTEILVPVGGNSFVFAKVASNKKAIVGIGSGISVEKPMDEAVKTIESRMQELIDTFNKLGERRSALEAQTSQLTKKIQETYQTMQQRI
ncbi:MAG: prefoldin subunit alpha [Methanomassiliicoccales archaeon]|jgi:prefoldin alpha subunit|nr:prefoldin subunit alpha [Methanomassiliicoccales archaeon]